MTVVCKYFPEDMQREHSFLSKKKSCAVFERKVIASISAAWLMIDLIQNTHPSLLQRHEKNKWLRNLYSNIFHRTICRYSIIEWPCLSWKFLNIRLEKNPIVFFLFLLEKSIQEIIAICAFFSTNLINL